MIGSSGEVTPSGGTSEDRSESEKVNDVRSDEPDATDGADDTTDVEVLDESLVEVEVGDGEWSGLELDATTAMALAMPANLPVELELEHIVV